MAENRLIPIENTQLRKANILISAKYKSTLQENQLTALALTRIQQNLDDGHEEYTATIYPSEIKRLFEKKNNIYRSLKQAARTMMGKQIFVEDGNGNFYGFVLIPNAKYEDGVFTVTFNKEIKPLISNLQKNFTNFDVAVLMSFSSNNAYRLYELFKKELYESNRKLIGNIVQLEYSIAELKFTIGICDINNPDIQNIKARMGNNIDYDVLYDKLPSSEKKYTQSSDFIRRIIKPAQKELLKECGLKFDYEGIKTKGNLVGRIKFTIYMDSVNSNISGEISQKADYIAEKRSNIDESDNANISEFSNEISMELYQEFVGFHNLTKEDIDLLCKKANYDVTRVKDAIYYADSRGNISEFMNYVVSVVDHPEWDIEGTAVVNGKDINPELRKIGKEVIKQQKKQENEKKNPKQIWENVIKTRDDFDEFLAYMEEKDNWSIDDFELIWTYDEMIDYWKKWKMNK